MAHPVRDDLVALATQFGVQPTRILQTGPGRTTVQARDDGGTLFVLKTVAAPGALAGDVDGNRTLQALGLPVPEIVDYRHGPPSVLILRWIDGDPVTAASPVEAQRDVGRILRVVHEQPGGPPFSGHPTIGAWISAWTEEMAAWWPSVGADGDQVRRLRDWLDELQPVLAHREGCLTLFDGRAEHFLVRDGGVLGLIDLHGVGPGDPAMDLAVIGLSDARLVSEVLHGYRADEDRDRHLRTLIPFYLLLRRLAAADWVLRNGSRSEGRRLLRLALRQASTIP